MSGAGAAGAGVGPFIMRAISDGGLDIAAASEGPTAVVAFGL